MIAHSKLHVHMHNPGGTVQLTYELLLERRVSPSGGGGGGGRPTLKVLGGAEAPPHLATFRRPCVRPHKLFGNFLISPLSAHCLKPYFHSPDVANKEIGEISGIRYVPLTQF